MSAGLSGFHFAQPLWFWLLLAPLLFWWWPQARRSWSERQRLERYADAHLLPHLMLGGQDPSRVRRRLALWTLIWALGVIAMAGPRLGHKDVSVYQPGINLVILLDLSRSMAVSDVKPSRLARARQEIEDLLDGNAGVRTGLIAFASVSHVVAPITEDDETLRHLLPSLSTDLVRWQGSRLSGALERARRLLESQPPDNAKVLLLITDGDLAEPGLEQHAGVLADEGMRLHVLGVGSAQGGQVPAQDGGWIRDQYGQPVISRTDEAALQALAEAGGGTYRLADFRDEDTRALLEAITSAEGRPQAVQSGSRRIWNERYHLPLALMMILLLVWFHQARSVHR